MSSNLPSAERCLNEAVARDDSQSEVCNSLGNIHFLRRDYTKAVSAYREAWRLEPMNHEAMHDLGRALDLAGRPSEARPYLENSVRSAPATYEARKRQRRARLGLEPSQ